MTDLLTVDTCDSHPSLGDPYLSDNDKGPLRLWSPHQWDPMHLSRVITIVD